MRCQPLQLGLQIVDNHQPLVPALLQLRRDEAIVGIDGVVLTTRAADFVARLFESLLELPPLVLTGAAARLLRRKRRLDP